ncbi:RsmB/NOP family class I SAM-dependent RNA methyltransferase [Aestuariicoccus sp. MJ-SS9]|uniref:RsmB/NOP family class I SAM-dependent RNA methyltransferase n=1 Tax=Aestuariicoccus sp. MJ-SS9 TaxID=3079855 RepID=UPI00290B9251|nr:RsmB/NOP family class I SAM-dependent RNA methyltransferase [Aestuariicoccus sp. MJ-SS9]MDU8912647.1 RsmB/NOP family class I SAM-dependent RNA methyltransferase [Aestuariicoccus sp. MJ-SS9]
MTPAARVQAAIEVLARMGDGVPAEKALTNWARGARYAGSGDRAAVRDLVFDILRTRRSAAARGGGEGGRTLMIGHLRQSGLAIETLFDGSRHGPSPLTEQEGAGGRAPTPQEAADLPDWLFAAFRVSLGEQASEVAEALRHRAPTFLRVNMRKTDVAAAQAALAAEGVGTEPVADVPTALRVTENPRRIQNSAPYRDGLVELQDAASQKVVDLLPLTEGARVLDYCAGGGGKALAMAARTGAEVIAHDADPRRMRDLPVRAQRAGAVVTPVDAPEGAFDLVLCDAPCSGSGSWRRAPEGKWLLTPERLEDLMHTQDQILEKASALVADGGYLAYVTCSVLDGENANRVTHFLSRRDGWTNVLQNRFLPGKDGDGFFLALLRHA